MTEVIPCGEFVTVEYKDINERGGLVLPEKHAERRYYVKAVGPDVKRCKVGDELLLNPQAPCFALSDEGLEQIQLVEQKHIIGVYKRTESRIIQ